MLCAAKIFQDHMILQRGQNVRIFGKGEPGSEITASIQNQAGRAETAADGNWELEIPSLTASGKEILEISDGKDSIVFQDVAVGEVWIAGGQSNMEFWMRYEKFYQDAVKDCENRDIRFYDVPEIAYDGQYEEFDYSKVGIWRVANPSNLEYYSAVGYYFAKNLNLDLDIPVGVIGCNWGGTTSSAWMSRETLEKIGQPWLRIYEEAIKKLDMSMEDFWKLQHGYPMNDTGNSIWVPFNEFAMPQTPTLEEVYAMMNQNGISPDEMAERSQMLQVQAIPSSLYEHMVKSIAPYTAKGFLWYQGESDDVPGCQALYGDMLAGLIGDWRALWKKQDMPFLVVQLPGFREWLWVSNQDYTTIRRMQEQVCNTVENTYLCSISDLGEEMDIHPKNKRDVGMRLSLLARRHVYKEDIPADAPRIKSADKKEHRIVITFKNAAGGMEIRGEKLQALTLEMDGKFLEYTASVDEDKLCIVTDAVLDHEVKAAFAQTGWYQVNLYNSAGIPAIPFLQIC